MAGIFSRRIIQSEIRKELKKKEHVRPTTATVREITGNKVSLTTDGSRVLLRNVEVLGDPEDYRVGSAVTIDWVDRAASYSKVPVVLGGAMVGAGAAVLETIIEESAHDRLHNVTSVLDHSITGSSMDLLGAVGTNTIGIITPSSNPGAASTVLKSDSSGNLTLKGLQLDTSLSVGAAGAYLSASASGVIINDGSSSTLDFRVEGDNTANLLFVDASADKIGINNGSPSYTLDVTGDIYASSSIYAISSLLVGASGNYFKAAPSAVVVNENQADIDFRVESDISDYLIAADAGLDKVGIGTNSLQAKLNILGGTPQVRVSYDGSSYSEFSVGASGTLTITTSTGGNLGLSPDGDVVFNPGGNDILPETNYDLNIGGIQKKYLTLHAAELWVETLVAQETIATIGGRIIVAPTTMLTADLGAQTDVIASLNPSFETSGGGGADVFASWSESAGNGTITKSGAQYYHGAYSCALTAGTSFNTFVYQTFSGLALQYICWTFWARGNGSVAGRYGLYNVTGGSYIIGVTSTGVTGTTWTQVKVDAFIPSGADNVRFELWCPTTNGAPAYFDLVSILTYPVIQVKHNLFAVGDIIHLESNGKFEFMKIDSTYTGSAGAYKYDVTRNLDGTGANAWYAGDAVVNTGQAGSGYMDLYSMESVYGRSPDYLYNYNHTGAAFSINYAGTTSWSPFGDGANTEINDAVYIGNATTFGSLNVLITSAAVSTVTYAYEYWNGSAWTTLGTITRTLDGVDAGSTENFETTGTWVLSWSIPGSWAQNTVNSISAYWVRIRISAFTSYGTVASAVGKRAHIGKSQWGPTIVGWRRSSATWNDVSEYWAIGNLNGLYGYGLDTPGAAFGRYAAGNTWVGIDATYGFRVNVGGASYTTIGQWDTSGNVTVGVSNGAHLYIANAGAITIYDSGNVQRLLADTSGIVVGRGAGYNRVFINDTGMYIYNSSNLVTFEAAASTLIVGDDATGEYVRIDQTNGVQLYGNGVQTVQIDTSGNARFGSDASGKANMVWYSGAGTLNFRTGTSAAQAYIDTDGAITAGGGSVKLNSTGIILQTGTSSRRIYWRDAFGDTETAAYIVGQTYTLTSLAMYASHISKLASQDATVVLQADTLALSGVGKDCGAQLDLRAFPNESTPYGRFVLSLHNGTAWSSYISGDSWGNAIYMWKAVRFSNTLYLGEDWVTYVQRTSGQNSIQIGNNDGYVQIGSINNGWMHFYSNRTYYFNPGVVVDGDFYKYGYPWGSWYSSMGYSGWSAKPSGSFYYKKIGKFVYCHFALSGTSNGSWHYVTLPSNCVTSFDLQNVINANNNGSSIAAAALVQTANPNRLLFLTLAGGSLSSSGTVGVYGHFFYEEQ